MSDWNEHSVLKADATPDEPSPAPAAVRQLTSRTPVGSDASEAHLMDYVRVLYKRRWAGGAVFLTIVLGVTIYTFTATPVYEAGTRLLIEADNPNVLSFKQVIEEEQQRADYYQTQYNILQSRALARKTLDALKLWKTPPFGGERDGFSVRNAIGGSIAWVTGLASSAPPPDGNAIRDAEETQAQSNAIDQFLASLTIAPVRNSRLVDLRFRSSDGPLATRVVNQLAKSYIEQDLEYRFMASKEASDWLGQQLTEQRKQVEAAETSLQQYREHNDAISLEDRENIVVQRLTELSTAVTRAKTERLTKESSYRQIKAIENNPAALDTFPAILGNQFIQQQKGELANLQRQRAQMAERFGDRHPEMTKVQSAIESAQHRIQGEIAKVVLAVRSEYQAAVAQEQSLAAALEQQKGEALTMNRRAIEYSVLNRDVESNKEVYDSLLQRAKETNVSGELKSSNIRVVDAAEVPQSPSSPRKRLNLLMGLFAGTLLACAVVFFFEYMDNRIKTPDEIRAHLGLPALGLLPRLPKDVTEAGHALINGTVPANFSEAFRALRTNVLFSAPEMGSRSILITSSGPGEGKTMVATNMAVSLAHASQRVLLIDADMRRPKAHEAFDLRQEPGLSNLLVGNAKASESIRKTPVPGLWMLPAGRIPPNPAELLGSVKFRDFLKSLREHFDWVIIDTPPVMAVTDAAILAHVANGVVFVVGAEMTSRFAAARALDQLQVANAQFVGAVLNGVDLQRHSYYYSHYYRKEYVNYYTPAQAAPEVEPKDKVA